MTAETHHQRVLIVDFGSQVTQLIARRVREAGVYCEIHPFDKAEAVVDDYAPSAIILSGGPASVHEADSPAHRDQAVRPGRAMLAICYGQQLLCDLLGGKVEGGHAGEFGRAELTIGKPSPLFQGLAGVGELETVWMSHGDRVTAIPEGFEVIATSTGAPFAAIANDARKIYAVQFHPEVVHTVNGSRIYKNFLAMAGLKGDWTMAAFRQEMVAEDPRPGRRRQGDLRPVGRRRQLGGRGADPRGDRRATDLRVRRHRPAAQERGRPGRHPVPRPLQHPADPRGRGDLFLGELAGVSDPETKRKTIGKLFIDVFDKEAGKIDGAAFLAQGTLYPDVVESVSARGGPSAVIKSHHNVGGLPDYMKLKLVEPLRELFKDEVRALGVELGLAPAFVGRHPFPGPGLAIRIPGEITPEKVKVLQDADAIYLEEIRNAGLYDKIWQAFAVLLPVKTVGVMGDARTYENVLALRAVTSTDGMTADFFEFPWDVLGKTATRIINEVRGVNRVVYDVTSKPPGTIEWEFYLTAGARRDAADGAPWHEAHSPDAGPQEASSSVRDLGRGRLRQRDLDDPRFADEVRPSPQRLPVAPSASTSWSRCGPAPAIRPISFHRDTSPISRCLGRPSTGSLPRSPNAPKPATCLSRHSRFMTFVEPARPCSMRSGSTEIGSRNASLTSIGARLVVSITSPNTPMAART
jgi:GMP synthase (glutamine-hydrolysing)